MNREVWRFAFVCFAVIVSVVPMVAAYGFGFPYYWSPEELLQSEWARFSLAFVFFYALLFFAAKGAFKDSAQVAVVVAAVGALVISYALLVRGYLNFLMDNSFLDTLVLIALIILLGVLVRFLYAHATKGVGIMTVFLMWGGFFLINNSGHSSLSGLPSRIRDILDLVSGLPGFVVALIIAGIIAMKGSKHKIPHPHTY